MATKVKYGDLPFAEAVEFFKNKLNVPTRKWNDLWQEQHDVAFMVAGAMQADLLLDLRQAVERALAEGTSADQFRREFERIVANRGWTGWTGETTKKGRAWRAKVIFDTNMRQSYSAGRERQMADPGLLKRRPYGLYRHGDSIVPRVEHLAWDNKVVPLDDPWWETHTPQNGWMCSCKKFALSEADVRRRGLTIARGEDMPYPGEGVDEEFAYRPGGDEVRRVYASLKEKAERYPAGLRGAFNKLLDRITGRRFDVPVAPPMAARMVSKRGVSDEFEAAVREAVAAIPAPVQELLDEAGYQVVAGTSVVDALPHLGKNWQRYDGATSIKSAWKIIAIGEYSKPLGKLVKTDSERLKGVVLHEAGHGVELVHDLARNPRIQDAFERDKTRLERNLPHEDLDQDMRDELEYILNARVDGLRDVLAELFAVTHGGKTAVNLIQERFPRTAKEYADILEDVL